MFIDNARFLFSEIHCEKSGDIFAYRSDFFPLLTKPTGDGSLLVKDNHGNRLGRVKNMGTSGRYLFLAGRQVIDGEMTEFRSRMHNSPLSKRIIDYMENYYGKYITNCSTLAEYLTTGQFRECDSAKDSFMFSRGLTGYTGQKIKPGDALCVLYYRSMVKNRRISDRRKHYIACEKGSRLDLSRLAGKNPKTFSPEEFLGLYHSRFFGDYHFMVCVGISNGLPVFIQQAGRHHPGKDDISDMPIIVSIGMISFSHHDVPAFMFIKRGD